ncbi:MAG TPA: hypothetical protein VFW05_00165 [Verrucomicrobiae bacterium]|nr:hypothetical protein [Verrucomicrobiae bacterium]
MKVAGNSLSTRREQGFEVYELSNQELAVAVVPELGARIISLRNRRTGREWMWHPPGGLKLFRNRSGDPFFKSPLVGMDECLPTIEPCVWNGRLLPDHGEVWSAAWSVDEELWANGILKTEVELKQSPFRFERTLELQGNEIQLSYELTHSGTQDECYLWSLHPLLRLQPGDALNLPESTRELIPAGQMEIADLILAEGRCAKTFATPLSEGFVELENRISGDRLAFEWNAAENDTLGIWLTRGGWHGHHHLALEPTNGDSDALSIAAAQSRCGIVRAGSSNNWQLKITIG